MFSNKCLKVCQGKNSGLQQIAYGFIARGIKTTENNVDLIHDHFPGRIGWHIILRCKNWWSIIASCPHEPVWDQQGRLTPLEIWKSPFGDDGKKRWVEKRESRSYFKDIKCLWVQLGHNKSKPNVFFLLMICVQRRL